MQWDKENEQYQEEIRQICPHAIAAMREMLVNVDTPVSSKVQLISMILDRTLGKTETPLRVTAEPESIESAEAGLAMMIREIQEEGRNSLLWGKNDKQADDGAG